MKNYKILIVEDEVLIANYIYDMLDEFGFTEIELAHSYDEGLEKMRIFQPEIILMDINLGTENNGIELAKLKNFGTSVIFLTAQNDINTIQQALDINPESYLTKPLKEIDVITAINLAIRKKQGNYLMIKNGHMEEKIFIEQIFYIESDKNYIDVHTKEKKLTLRYSLSDFLEKLPSSNFYQINRSTIINTDFVDKIATREVAVHGRIFSVSRSFDMDLLRKKAF